MKLTSKRLWRSADFRLLLLLFSYTAAAAAQAPGTFIPTGNMTTPRTLHTATLLLNGKVLITGGADPTRPGSYLALASAELFDPNTGTFTATGNMTTRHIRHSATLLADGRVLITAGKEVNDTGAFANLLGVAELYDPSTGTFTATGNMVRPVAGSTSTLLNSGKVLISGTCQDWFYIDADAERVDGHTATLLLDGGVLITGGWYWDPAQGSLSLASAELFDPETGVFTATGNMTTGRSFHSATLLSDGRVLIAGGASSPDTFATAELYDPTAGIFTPTGHMLTDSWSNTATLLNNGKVLITGSTKGERYGGYDDVADNPELYDPITGVFTSTGDYADRNAPTTWGLLFQNASATLLPNGNVLIAGEPTAELYDPALGRFSLTHQMLAQSFTSGALDPLYIGGRTATLLTDGNVLLVGGENEDLGWFTAELYDPSTGKFRSTSGNMTAPRDYGHSATLLRDGTVLIAGGQRGREFSAELYDPITATFSAVANMTSPRFLHTATLLMDGRVLIVGGHAQYSTNSGGTAELYVPSVLIPAPVVNSVRIDRSKFLAGSSYSVNVSGSNLTPQTFFDVRFNAPGSNPSDVVLNWQRGLAANHDVSAGTTSGNWTINGVRPHDIETDHTGSFFPVSATMTVSP